MKIRKLAITTGILLSLDSCAPAKEPVEAPGIAPNRGDIGVFMRTYVNPPFSQLSFALHKRDAGGAETLTVTANELARAAAELGDWPEPPTDAQQGRQVFYEYAAALRSDTKNLVDALSAGNRDAAIKVFEELRKKCDSCHHYFRYGE